jgi:hypothetical protein
MAEWWWKAEYFETCNCDYGCPCNTTSIPTDGTCQAINAWEIREGAFGDVRLDGLGVALLSRWPNAIHEGNGRGVFYISERADDAQREALGKIGRGEAGGGGPFEIFNSTYVEPANVVHGPFEFERSGKDASVKLGDLGHATLEPIRSAMDGSPADVHLVVPGGFIFEDGEIVNTAVCEVKADGLDFRHEGTNGFLSEVTYNA